MPSPTPQSSATTKTVVLDRSEVERLLPHRDPLLLVDRVVELDPGKRAVSEHDVRSDAFWTKAHFPARPIMPGVLIIEALAQTAGVCAVTLPGFTQRLGVLAGVDGVRFRRTVVPGEVLRCEATVLRMRSSGGRARAAAYVGSELVAEAELLIVLLGPDATFEPGA